MHIFRFDTIYTLVNSTFSISYSNHPRICKESGTRSAESQDQVQTVRTAGM